MRFTTHCLKRNNMVHIRINTDKKTVTETIFYLSRYKKESSPQMLRRATLYGDSIRQTVAIYYGELTRHEEMGYEVKEEKKEGKILHLYQKDQERLIDNSQDMVYYESDLKQ